MHNLTQKGKNSTSSIYVSKCLFHLYGVYKQICYLFQYPSKIPTETADGKIKIGVTKNDDKKILLVIADLNLVTKGFQKHKYCHKTVG